MRYNKHFYEKDYESILSSYTDTSFLDFGDLYRIKMTLYLLSSIRIKLKVNKKITILDIGGGMGLYLVPIKKFFGRLGIEVKFIITDIAKNALKRAENIANANGIEADFIASDVSKVNIGKQKADLILLIETIEHVPHDEQLTKKCLSFLSPEGYIIVSAPNALPFPLSRGWFELRKYKKFRKDQRVGHLRRYTPARLETLFASNGFAVIDVKNYGFVIHNRIKSIVNKVLMKFERKLLPLLAFLIQVDILLPKFRTQRSDGIFLLAKKAA